MLSRFRAGRQWTQSLHVLSLAVFVFSFLSSAVGGGILGFHAFPRGPLTTRSLFGVQPTPLAHPFLPKLPQSFHFEIENRGCSRFRDRLHVNINVFGTQQARTLGLRSSSLQSTGTPSHGTSQANSTRSQSPNQGQRKWKWKKQPSRPGTRTDSNRTGRPTQVGGNKARWNSKSDQRHQRPLLQQVNLNKRISQCQKHTDVLRELREAKKTGLALNSVNIATALHRIAKTTNPTNLPQEYVELVQTANEALGDPSNDFNSREMANTAWGLAKARWTQPSLWEGLSKAVVRRGLERYNPQEIANTVWAFATVYNLLDARERGRHVSIVSGLLDTVAKELEGRGRAGQLREFKPQELSNTMWSFATIGKEASPVFAAVAAEMRRRELAGFSTQDMANSVWAFVTAGESAPELLDCVATQAVQLGLSAFNRQELANLAWAFAKASHPADRLLAQVEAEVLVRPLGMFRTQELSNLVWAFATAGRPSPALFAAVAGEAVHRTLAPFKSQEIANVLWAFAKTGCTAPALFAAAEREVLQERDLTRFVPQELSNTLWSFAKLGHDVPTVFNSVAAEMTRRGLHCFKTQELSNAVWAHATTGLHSPGLFEAVEEEALRRGLEAFSAQDLANMVWAFGKADYVVGARLLFALQTEFERARAGAGATQFKAQELSNLLWACAKTQYIARGRFNQAEASVRSLVQDQHQHDPPRSNGDDATVPLEVPGDMRRFAQIGQQAEEMFGAVEEELLRRELAEFELQHLANMAWAFVFLKHSRFHRLSQSGLRLLDSVLDAAEERIDQFAIEELRQLGQVVMAAQRKEEGESRFARRVKEALRASYDRHAAAQPDSSDFHLEVSHMLELLGVPHTNEVKVFEGVYHIDIVVGEGDPTDGRGKIAVEVDGPSHFVVGTEEPNAHTALKRWLLQREGYTVLSIPYFDWGPLQGRAVCSAYMAYRLEEAGWDMKTMRLELCGQ